MAQAASVDALKGSWDYVRIESDWSLSSSPAPLISNQVDGEHFDAYMKELGVGMVLRMTAKGIKPRLIISEKDGKWTLRTESSIKTITVDFQPGVEFDETTADGREVKVRLVDGSTIVFYRSDLF